MSRDEFRNHAHKFSSHREALKFEIRLQVKKTPYQRMLDFIELQKRVWGEDCPDIRESGFARKSHRNFQ